MKISTQNVCLTSQYGIEKGFRMLREAGFEGVYFRERIQG